MTRRRAPGLWRACVIVLVALICLAPSVGWSAQPAQVTALDDGDILVADPTAGAIIGVKPTTGAQTVFASGGLLVEPRAVLQGAEGQIYVADRRCCGGFQGGIIQIDPPSGLQTILMNQLEIAIPRAMVLLPDGRLLVSADLAQLVLVDPTLPYGRNYGPIGLDGRAHEIGGLAVHATGNILFTDDRFDLVARLNQSSLPTFVVLAQEGEFRSPRGIVGLPIGFLAFFNAVVADADCCGGTGGLVFVDLTNGNQTVISSGGNFVDPDGLTIAPDGFYLVADPNAFGGNGGVIRVNPVSGVQTVVSSGGRFRDPTGIAVYRNRAPVLTSSPGEAVYIQGGPAVQVDPGMALSDDSADFGGGRVTAVVVTNATADDRLEIQSQGTAAGQIGVTGTSVTFGGVTIGSVSGGSGGTPLDVRLTGSVAPPAVQALLRAITFRVATVAPSTPTRTIRFVVDDGRGGASVSTPAERRVTVVVQNSPPTQTVPTGLTTPINVPLVFSAATRNAITVADPDAGAADVRTTLTATAGALTLGSAGQVPPLTSVTGNGTARVVLQGTTTEVTSALDGLTFVPASGPVGSVTLTVTTDDLGNTGSGGALAVTSAILITILPAVQVPVVQPEKPSNNDTVKPRLESAAARLQRERTNRSGRDDVATEGNVLATGLDEQGPYLLIANRDGLVRIRLTGPAIFTTVRVGDYVQIDGEKVNEQLYIATDVTVAGR